MCAVADVGNDSKVVSRIVCRPPPYYYPGQTSGARRTPGILLPYVSLSPIPHHHQMDWANTLSQVARAHFVPR